jgi:hypothetical protein
LLERIPTTRRAVLGLTDRAISRTRPDSVDPDQAQRIGCGLGLAGGAGQHDDHVAAGRVARPDGVLHREPDDLVGSRRLSDQ